MITVRDATAADIVAYYGAPLAHTVTALVVLKADRPVGIIGFMSVHGRRILFSESTPELGEDRYAFTVRRAIFRMLRRACATKLPVFSVNEPGSDVLTRLGFELVSGDLYRWPPSQPSPPTSPPPAPP